VSLIVIVGLVAGIIAIVTAIATTIGAIVRWCRRRKRKPAETAAITTTDQQQSIGSQVVTNPVNSPVTTNITCNGPVFVTNLPPVEPNRSSAAPPILTMTDLRGATLSPVPGGEMTWVTGSFQGMDLTKATFEPVVVPSNLGERIVRCAAAAWGSSSPCSGRPTWCGHLPTDPSAVVFACPAHQAILCNALALAADGP